MTFFQQPFATKTGSAGARMSQFWILLELRLMEVLVTTGAIRRAKLQSNRHRRQTNTLLFTRPMPFLSPNQQFQSTDGKKYHIPQTCWHQTHLGFFQPCLWQTKAPSYLQGKAAKHLISPMPVSTYKVHMEEKSVRFCNTEDEAQSLLTQTVLLR